MAALHRCFCSENSSASEDKIQDPRWQGSNRGDLGQYERIRKGRSAVDSRFFRHPGSGWVTRWIAERRVGGVALFSRNIVDLAQTVRLTRQLHRLAGDVPLFVALDQEGGNVVRVRDGATLLPGNMALGATRDPGLAYVAGQALAIDLHRLGFNMNLAPVLDINSNPNNPVIGVRSYGERAELVGQLGSWYVRGQQEMGVVAVAKHFPGHGDTQSDSHFAMPTIEANLDRLRRVELQPFATAIAAGLDAVMTAHIALPQIAEGGRTPATLSPTLLSKVLRTELGFDGLIITDGLEMRGIVEEFGSGRAAVLAILAGADMPMVLWTPAIKEEVYAALLAAVRSKEISPSRLNRSVRRILRAKWRRGLFQRSLEDIKTVLGDGNRNPIHQQVADQIAAQAQTLVRNQGGLLPLRGGNQPGQRVLALVPPGALAKELERSGVGEVLTMPFVPKRAHREALARKAAQQAAKADILVLAVANRYHVALGRAVMARAPHLRLAMVSLASPYYLRQMPRAQAYVCAYSYLDSAQKAVADVLLGRAMPTGRLPVSIPGFYAYGHRIEDRWPGVAALAPRSLDATTQP